MSTSKPIVLDTTINIRHSTKAKYAGFFDMLISSGFNRHIDSTVPRTDLLKVTSGAEALDNNLAERVHKSISQKARNFCESMNQLVTNPNEYITIRVYKHFIAGDGWYFCLLLVTGDINKFVNTSSKITSEPRGYMLDEPTSVSIENANVTVPVPLVNILTAIPQPASKELPAVQLTEHDKEMIRLYGDLYVPDSKR